MEAVLHIEPVFRNTHIPISVGHTEDVFYGEKLTSDGENVGDHTSHIRLGCPLEALDFGSNISQVPMVKTIEYSPDFSRASGNVYSETLHYFKDRKFLIPFRTKIRSGLGGGLRLNHLPSLNLVRDNVVGLSRGVSDPRLEIVTDILMKDQRESGNQNRPLQDWISEDLTQLLSAQASNPLTFNTDNITGMINRYSRQIHQTSNELSSQALKDIVSIIAPNGNRVPTRFMSNEPLQYSLGDVRHRLVNHPHNFKSFGRIPVEKLPRIDYNPFDFKEICELLDVIPLTDFNVDVVITHEAEIVFYHENLVIDRFNVFADYESGLYDPNVILADYIDGHTLNDILYKFVQFHSSITPEIAEAIEFEAVKFKIIKTISDEALILLYKAAGEAGDEPLCGVYFDIALQSLAPMSIIATPIVN
jgi:hypothetical protein